MAAPSVTPQETLELVQELRSRLARLERLVAPKPVALPLREGSVTVLLLGVSDLEIAIPLDAVDEVVPFAWLTPIPEAPPWVAGLLDLGGKSLCVVDVAARLTGASRPPRAEDFIVVCRVGERQVGLSVHALRHLATFPSTAVAAPPADVPSAPYLIGTLSQGEAPILLLSVEQLLHGSALPEATP